MAELREVELVRIEDDGSGYAVLHLDDGTSCGQNFRGAPVADPTQLTEFLTKVADETLARQIAPAPVVPSVKGMVGQRLAPKRPVLDEALDRERARV
jgi:hypothetical protein